MILLLFHIFLCILLVEAITEVVVKSDILIPIRNFFISKAKFFEDLLACGYCFSFWASLFIIILLSMFNKLPIITEGVLNYLYLFFIMQRGSNILHGAIDRYFATKKDIRYNREH